MTPVKIIAGVVATGDKLITSNNDIGDNKSQGTTTLVITYRQ
jgi:hypothetical protein